MGYFICIGHQVHVDGAGHVRLPVIRGLGKKYQSEEDTGENSRDGQRPDSTAKSPLHWPCGSSWRQRELRGILRRAGRDTDHD